MNEHVHPTFRPLLDAISGSPAVVAAAASTRTPSDVLLARLAPRPCWDIWVLPQLDEPWRLEMTLTQHMNERAAMACLADCADRFNLAVIYTDADGKRHDVSKKFAEALAIDMAREGFEAETIQRYEFVGHHFTSDEIEQICRGG